MARKTGHEEIKCFVHLELTHTNTQKARNIHFSFIILNLLEIDLVFFIKY